MYNEVDENIHTDRLLDFEDLDADPKKLWTVAAKTKLPHNLELIAQHTDHPTVLIKVAKNKCTGSWVHQLIARKTKHESVLEAVAQNTEDEGVLKAVAANSYVDKKTLELIAKKTTNADTLRLIANKTKDENTLKAVAENPHTHQSTLKSIEKRKDISENTRNIVKEKLYWDKFFAGKQTKFQKGLKIAACVGLAVVATAALAVATVATACATIPVASAAIATLPVVSAISGAASAIGTVVSIAIPSITAIVSIVSSNIARLWAKRSQIFEKTNITRSGYTVLSANNNKDLGAEEQEPEIETATKRVTRHAAEIINNRTNSEKPPQIPIVA